MKWLLVVLLVVAAALAVATAIGAMLPVRHQAEGSLLLPRSTQPVWDVISRIDAYPGWRSGIAAVAALPEKNGHPMWQERDARGRAIAYETLESLPGQRLVRQIADPNLSFGGSWTFELSSEAGATRLTIREDGEVRNPLFRFIARFVIGYNKTIDTYLADVRAKLG